MQLASDRMRKQRIFRIDFIQPKKSRCRSRSLRATFRRQTSREFATTQSNTCLRGPHDRRCVVAYPPGSRDLELDGGRGRCRTARWERRNDLDDSDSNDSGTLALQARSKVPERPCGSFSLRSDYLFAAADATESTGRYPVFDAFFIASTVSSAVSSGVVLIALQLPPAAKAMAIAAASTLV